MGKSKKPIQIQRCKCCLEEISLKEMWTEYFNEGEREIYGEMLSDCFALAWEQPFEKTAEHICDSCVSRLRDAVSFKKEILYSDQVLNEHAKNESELKVKLEEESDAEIETEYLEFIEEDGPDKGKNIDIKVEPDKSEVNPISEETLSSNTKRRYTDEDLEKCLEAVKNKSLSQTKASIIYHVPRKTISAALAKMKVRAGTILPRRRNGPELKQRKENLDVLLKYTNATPFKGFRKGFICYFCSEEYENPAELKDHNTEHLILERQKIKVTSDKSVKLDVTNLTCTICEQKMTSIENAFEHLRIDHDINTHTDAKDQLVPFKFDDKTLKCVVCSEEFTSFKILNDHVNLKHFKNYECLICGRGFINKRSLQSHRYIHETGVYTCRFCLETFTRRIQQWEHERYYHMNKKKRNKCVYCDERFYDTVTKKRHQAEVHGAAKKVYRCKACENAYTSKGALNRHVESYHLLLRPYNCPICDLSFHKKTGLNVHMVKHTGDRSYKCDLCLKCFGRKQTLRDHIRIHANDRRFKCEHCEMSFVHRVSWRGHMLKMHSEHV